MEQGYRAILGAMADDVRKVEPGVRIVREGEPHDRIYHLDAGWVARSRQLVDGDRPLIMTFLPNDIFGVKCLLLDKQPDDIVALSQATVRSTDRWRLSELAAREPGVSLHLMFQLAEDERRLHNSVLALARPAIERIAFMLLELRGRLDRLGLLQGDEFRLPMTQQDIGDTAGISYVHVNRTLRELRERGLVSVERSVVKISDLRGLRKLAYPLLDAFERNDGSFGA